MKSVKCIIFSTLTVCFVLFLSGCHNGNDFDNKNERTENETSVSVEETESQVSVGSEENTENSEEIVWNEVNENGVDADLLIKNIDEKTLTDIAQQLQDLCTEIDEKGKEDKNYWLTGQWYNDVVNSKQYKEVVSLGNKAMKPLFLIIYESKNSGIYEWVCSKA